MGKFILAIGIVLAASAALTIHEQGLDKAYGGVLARLNWATPEETVETEPTPAAAPAQAVRRSSTTEGASVNATGTNYSRVADRMRGRVE